MLISIILLLLPSLISVSALPPISVPSPNLYQPSNSTASVGRSFECYTPHEGIKPLDIHNCIRAVNLIRQDPLWEDVEKWSVPRSGHRVMRHWVWGPCTVAIFPRTDTAEDEFSLKTVAGCAMDVLTACVAKNDKYGGRIDVGPKGVFGVGVRSSFLGGDFTSISRS